MRGVRQQIVPVPDLHITICEYATIHTDNSHTIVRGGIEHWDLSELPATLSLCVLIYSPQGALPVANHQFAARVLTPGGLVIAKIEGVAQVTEAGTSHRVLTHFDASVQEYGAFVIDAAIGSVTGRLLLAVRSVREARDQ